MKTLELSLLFALLLAPSSSLAQSRARSGSSSSAFGLILLDGQDRPLRHARVEFLLTETAAAVSSLTDAKGQFHFAQLSPATYRITITAPGCEKLQFTAGISGKVGPMILRLHKSNAPPATSNSPTISLARLTMPGKPGAPPLVAKGGSWAFLSSGGRTFRSDITSSTDVGFSP